MENTTIEQLARLAAISNLLGEKLSARLGLENAISNLREALDDTEMKRNSVKAFRDALVEKLSAPDQPNFVICDILGRPIAVDDRGRCYRRISIVQCDALSNLLDPKITIDEWDGELSIVVHHLVYDSVETLKRSQLDSEGEALKPDYGQLR